MSAPRRFKLPGFKANIYASSLKEEVCLKWLANARKEYEAEEETREDTLLELNERKKNLEKLLAIYNSPEAIATRRLKVIEFANQKENYFKVLKKPILTTFPGHAVGKSGGIISQVAEMSGESKLSPFSSSSSPERKTNANVEKFLSGLPGDPFKKKKTKIAEAGGNESEVAGFEFKSAIELGLLNEIKDEKAAFTSVDQLREKMHSAFSFADTMEGYTFVSFPTYQDYYWKSQKRSRAKKNANPLDEPFADYLEIKNQIDEVNKKIVELEIRRQRFSKEEEKRKLIRERFITQLNKELYKKLKLIISHPIQNPYALDELDKVPMNHEYHKKIQEKLARELRLQTLDWQALNPLFEQHAENVKLASRFVDGVCLKISLKDRLLHRLELERAEFRARNEIGPGNEAGTQDPRYVGLNELIEAIKMVKPGSEVKEEDESKDEKVKSAQSKKTMKAEATEDDSDPVYQDKLLALLDQQLDINNKNSLGKYQGFWKQLGMVLANIICSPGLAIRSWHKGENAFFSSHGRLYDAAVELKKEIKRQPRNQ